MYGKSIVFTYNGDDKFRTFIGGISSLFIGSIIIIYVMYLFYVMFKKHDTSVGTSTKIDDIFSEVKVHQPNLKNFDFGVALVANGIDYFQDPTVFNIEMNEVIQIWNSTESTATYDRTKEPVGFEV